MAQRYNRLRDFALLLRNIESFTADQARIVSYEEDVMDNIDVELCPSDGPYKGGTFFFRVSFINGQQWCVRISVPALWGALHVCG